MPNVLFDSSIYIAALRAADEQALGLRRTPNHAVWLSSVVLEELYAGSDARDLDVLERLERDFDRTRRMVVPNLSDWISAGKVLSRFAQQYNYESIGRGRITNDALIAMSAGRLGITVITANQRDFGRLAKLRPFRWQLGNG